MLQRRAKKIVWTISAYKDLRLHPNTCMPGVDIDTKVSIVVDQFFDKFGFGSKSADFLSNNQVFKEEEFHKLLCEFQSLIKAGKPAVIRRPQMAVLKNSWWNIEAYTIDLVMMYLAPCRDFEKLLPRETVDAITGERFFFNEGAKGTFANFPIYATIFHNSKSLADFLGLVPKQVNLLVAQAEFMVKASSSKLSAVLR